MLCVVTACGHKDKLLLLHLPPPPNILPFITSIRAHRTLYESCPQLWRLQDGILSSKTIYHVHINHLVISIFLRLNLFSDHLFFYFSRCYHTLKFISCLVFHPATCFLSFSLLCSIEQKTFSKSSEKLTAAVISVPNMTKMDFKWTEISSILVPRVKMLYWEFDLCHNAALWWLQRASVYCSQITTVVSFACIWSSCCCECL